MASQTALDEKPRRQLVEEARQMGVERPERMTRVELRDEIVRRSVPEDQQAEARGLFGVARSMLASVVDRGLNLPDAAKVIRGEAGLEMPVESRAPVATVTLAEIYAAQGHKQRALRVLDDVLREEPEHEEALRVRAELVGDSASSDVELARQDRQREAVTAEAPPVAEVPGATTEYVPGGYVETTGEEIQTGKPPVVEPVEEETVAAPAVAPVADEPDDGPEAVPALVLAQSSRGLAVYWELPQDTLDQCAIDPEDGRAALRIVAFSPHGSAPNRQETTVALAETIPVKFRRGVDAGKLRLDDFAEPMAVRAALGWETEDGFLPLSVGRSVEEWGADRSGSAVAQRAEAELS